MNWKQITKRKERAGLTWEEIARAASISDQTRRNWMNGTTKPKPADMQRFLDSLAVLERMQT